MQSLSRSDEMQFLRAATLRNMQAPTPEAPCQCSKCASWWSIYRGAEQCCWQRMWPATAGSLLHPWRITLRLECSWISGHSLDWIETWKTRRHHPSPFQLWTWENWAQSSSSNVVVLDLRMGSFARHIGRGDEYETKESSKTKTSTHHVRNMQYVVYVHSCDSSMRICIKYSIFFLFKGHKVTEPILSAKAPAMTGVASRQNQRRQWGLITWCRMAIRTKLESAKLPSSMLSKKLKYCNHQFVVYFHTLATQES